MSDPNAITPERKSDVLKSTLDQRIADLRDRKPRYVNHGETLLLQGIASASFRAQRLTGDKIELQ